MKKFKKLLVYIVIIVIISGITFYVGKQIGLNTDTSETTTTITEVTVGTQNITKTLTASGEIESQNEENLELSTSKYFKTMCVEEDDIVSEGENILQYSNGTYLTAPYDCIVMSYSVPETGTKASSSNYVTVQDLKNLTVKISVSESEILSISEGQKVIITLNADENVSYDGEISKISATGTYASNGASFTAYVNFENDGNAKLGMSVSCEITTEEKSDVIAVPIEAVKTDDDSKYVALVENGETKNVEVETGLSNGIYVEVTSGLTGGETIQIVTEVTESKVRSSDSTSSTGMGTRGEGASFGGEGMQEMTRGGSSENFGGKMNFDMPN